MQISRAQQHCCSTSSSSSAALAPQPARSLRRAAALPQRAQHHCTPDCPSTAWEQAATSSRRTALLSLAAAAATALALPRHASAKAMGVAEAGLAEYAANEQSGKFPKDLKALESFRSKYKFRRAADGRVSVQGSRGDWYSVRVDMEVAGAILLRNAKGYIYALQIDGLKQIDLSDDYIVLLLFADGDWEKSMTAVEYNDADGKTTHLKLDETEYRNVVGLLNEVASEGEEQQQQ